MSKVLVDQIEKRTGGTAMDVPAGGKWTAANIANATITATQVANDTITATQIAANAIGNSEMADDAVGIAELSATGPASATTYLRGDNAWATVASKDNLPAFYMTFTGGDQDISDAVITLINWNTSIYDTASGLNTTATGTNPRSYTVQTGGDGKWFLTWGVYCYGTAGRERSVEGNVYKNGSMVHTVMHSQTANDGFANHTCAGSVVIELVATDYVTVYGLVDVHSGTPRIASHAGATWFAGFRLAE